MRNRISRNPASKHSERYLQEQRKRMHAMRDPVVTAMYESEAWQVLRAQVRRDALGRCQWPGCRVEGLCVDHREPHRGNRELFFSRANLWFLCKSHHDKKTARFDGGFGNARKRMT